jgi:hypothetical protein
MATGMVDNWVNVDAFGPIYPFVGTEVLLTLLGLAFWIIWHIRQFKDDVNKIKERGGVGAVLDSEGQREISDLAGG